MIKQLATLIVAIILGGSAHALMDDDFEGVGGGGGGGGDGGGVGFIFPEVTVIGAAMADYELPMVTVSGSRGNNGISTDVIMWAVMGPYDPFVTGELVADDKPAIEKLKDPRKDVRALCAIGKADLASTTSLTDEVGRQDAVRALVGVNSMYWAARIVRGRFTGDTVPFGGMKEAIATAFTYADGGTEKWYVNPFISENAIVAPGSLKPGDGVAKDVPCKPTTPS